MEVLKTILKKLGTTELGTRQEDRKPAFETAWTTSRDQHTSMTGNLDQSLARATHIGHPTGLPDRGVAYSPPSTRPKYF